MLLSGRLLPSGPVEGPLKVSEANKTCVRRLYEDVWTRGKVGLLDTLIGAAYVDHNPASGQASGAGGVKARVETLRQAFPERQSSQKNPHGPQPASVTLRTARTSTNAARPAIPNSSRYPTRKGLKRVSRAAAGDPQTGEGRS